MTETDHDELLDHLREAAGCSGLAVRKAARAVGQLYDDALAPAGIKGTQFSLLAAVGLTSKTSVSALADSLVMDRTTLSRNLQPLVRAGLLKMAPGRDRRERRVALTEEGRSTLRTALPLWRQAQARIADALGEGRAARLRGDLAWLARSVLVKS
ncbi:MAG: winged helix-turn-helix transcriptional regulator [Rhodospirillaceae bacterium]|jgi:DNA-binding MarR family transcriptional regulator|nr:winged helix-turn-helix transcriptional regulator [Rhodospirillaceae bacterium]MBT6117807.1 winged helix-turn-helix transcriptional regulator [Rhodospirillaceae bacterium]